MITIPEPDFDGLEREADGLLRELFPICRSITGQGVRQTLDRLGRITPLEVREVPSGTRCYDWTVPDEWNIEEAYLADAAGNRIADFGDSNLHVVGYSVPVDATLTYQELAPHLHSLPQLPEAIPYRTTYYQPNWGFCLSHRRQQELDRNGTYRAVIRSRLEPGSLTYGQARVAGDSGREFLFSTYCCHPSLGNDNLSGMVLWTLLLRELTKARPRHSYRFVIAPETIGTIAFIRDHEPEVKKLAGGFVITCVAGPGPLGYKHTFQETGYLDRLVRQTFREQGLDFTAYPFDVKGSDERQYATPGLRVPLGTICKDKYYEYDYYHTSLDDLDFISAKDLVETLKLYWRVVKNLEMDGAYLSRNPICEPRLGKRGLYPATGGGIQQKAVDFSRDHQDRVYADGAAQGHRGIDIDSLLWLMFHCDGRASLLDIAERTGLPMATLYHNARALCREGLLTEQRSTP